MGIESAQSNAAWMLDRGFTHTGPQAAAVATVLFKRSAEQGNVMSLLQLGDCYYYGSGVAMGKQPQAGMLHRAWLLRQVEGCVPMRSHALGESSCNTWACHCQPPRLVTQWKGRTGAKRLIGLPQLIATAALFCAFCVADVFAIASTAFTCLCMA